MLDALITLAKAAAEIGTLLEVSMYKSGLITIDGITDEGMDFSITYRGKDTGENANENP